LSFSKSVASPEAIRDLNLQADREGSRVFEFAICLGVNEEPVMLSQITVSASYFRDLSEKVINEERDTIYGMYQSKYGVTLTRTVEKLRAVTANAYLARHLGLKQGQPLLQIYRIGYTFNNIPVELRTSYARTDRYHFLLKQGQVE